MATKPPTSHKSGVDISPTALDGTPPGWRPLRPVRRVVPRAPSLPGWTRRHPRRSTAGARCLAKRSLPCFVKELWIAKNVWTYGCNVGEMWLEYGYNMGNMGIILSQNHYMLCLWVLDDHCPHTFQYVGNNNPMIPRLAVGYLTGSTWVENHLLSDVWDAYPSRKAWVEICL